ncbi:unnamed protein product [Hydatigera taeniaeformis]|uniref:DUF1534 domain-containing protein n=1 Tax=Hydatigena taeniaeformis TaxID=6205 RepID=A0A0R3XCK2_HYDTA|nr:unnamed protein product [Hydatigera taeniaeformis]
MVTRRHYSADDSRANRHARQDITATGISAVTSCGRLVIVTLKLSLKLAASLIFYVGVGHRPGGERHDKRRLHLCCQHPERRRESNFCAIEAGAVCLV